MNDLQPYGSQKVATVLAAAYAQLGHDVTVITIESTSHDALLLADGVTRTMVVRRSRGARGYLQAVRDLRRALLGYRPDVVISHMVLSNVISLAATSWGALSSVPVVVTEHGIASLALERERSKRTIGALARRLYPRAARVVGVSDAVVADALSTYGLRHELGRTIYNPVDVASVRERGRIATGHPWLTRELRPNTLVCVGEFRDVKGQDLLIEAMCFLPGHRAIFLGGGASLEDGRALAVQLQVEDRIDFAGYSDAAPSFMAESAALVIPSRAEGFGLVAIEAAAVETPVVGTRVGGLLELIPRYVPGVLVEPEDAGALAEGIRSLLELSCDHGDLREFGPDEVAVRYLRAAGF
ncbi:glycosyltransferase [Mycolicibacterium sp.]|uniref:glycosyltransferase n=1 Tax=Mycolicibacterium sp. TaxID=2320850 RepID=UPI001A35C457|nr:glycosyltransferase [Mycolicibacterium sp.]MBJ7336716.1 glycosyltransferase [Mycolicibacterium sp.]